MKMLSQYILRLYRRFFQSRYAKRNLIVIFLCQVLLAVAFHVAFIFRRNYVRTYDVSAWFHQRTVACDGNFVGYGHQFLWLKNALVDVERAIFAIPCKSNLPKYWFYKGYQGTPYEEWLADMRTTDQLPGNNIRLGITLVVKRNEAHNPYHTFCEFYNIFLLAQHFTWDLHSADILLMDDRPNSQMDEFWKTLFGSVRQKSDVSPSERFSNLIWIPIGYESPMNFHLVRNIPSTEKFRSFVLDSFGITPRKMDCKNLKVVLILRHDYISHPERKTLFGGKIHRKFANEPEIIWALEEAFRQHTVKAVTLERLSVKEQLELVSSADVLIGMHGAGLANIMFLPPSACVLELFPYSYKWRAAYYFQAMANWRGLKYYVWTSNNRADEIEKGFKSNVPPEIITKLSGEIKAHINKMLCPNLPLS